MCLCLRVDDIGWIPNYAQNFVQEDLACTISKSIILVSKNEISDTVLPIPTHHLPLDEPDMPVELSSSVFLKCFLTISLRALRHHNYLFLTVPIHNRWLERLFFAHLTFDDGFS